uniref:Uncharacterized protein n=1 Tax=Anguilla anguilla TaxID=7936 RepID=A0A0E9TKB4_ANGAN
MTAFIRAVPIWLALRHRRSLIKSHYIKTNVSWAR